MSTTYPCDSFARVTLGVDLSVFSHSELAVVEKLVLAMRELEEIYFRQVSSLNAQFHQEIEDEKDPKLLRSFQIMAGPWDRLKGDEPFYGRVPKPLGAGFYPSQMSVEEFRAWISEHPEDRADFESYTTIIQKTDGKLSALPYSKAFAKNLTQCAKLLKEAAELSTNSSLSHFLNSRAEGLLSNDYVESEAAWLHLKDSPIEFVLGPYEVYEDKLLGLKACFEATLGYKDPFLSREVQRYASFVPEMQRALPIAEELKVEDDGSSPSPFSVIDLIFSSGEARHGIQAMAFVLPNDPAITEKYGTKKVLLRNIQNAKFDKILTPIAKRFMSKTQLKLLNFNAFFRHTILHETGHSLGPRYSAKDPKLAIYRALASAYSAVEETKADTLSLFLVDWLIKKGELNESCRNEAYAAMTAGFFRALRFGLNSAHAKANAIQMNYFLEKSAIIQRDNLCFEFVPEKLPSAVESLVEKVIQLEAEGSEAKALEFINKYAIIDDELKEELAALHHIPSDIEPVFSIEKREGRG